MMVRFLRFNLVGLLGIGVRLAVVALLAGAGHVHYLLATAVGVEAAVLHNFFWHEHWTFARRAGYARGATAASPDPGAMFFRCAAFHAGNGLVSLLGSLAILPLLVGRLGLHYLPANLVAVLLTGLINFLLSDRGIFRAGRGR